MKIVYCFVCSEEFEIPENEKAIWAYSEKYQKAIMLGFAHQLCQNNFKLTSGNKVKLNFNPQEQTEK